ncbi:TPA: 1-phosphofructokinase [Staphylococcus aureus]|nr:1-phosphofructokinase [Staphylococcus aureus]
MIYTVTFNPSIDYVIFTNDFKIDGLNRATATYKFAGGKGINVSRVLKTLDVESTALGFAGGFPGKFIIDTLNNSAIQSNFIEVDEDTRINVKLKTGQETEINAPGPHITSTQFEQLLQQIKNTTSEDIVIVAGSVPSSIPSDAYAQIAQITAAMIGGMIPPLAIATAMLIFRRKFTKEQRGSIIPNYVMGMSFITEGAIPFAAADPLRVIPSMMIGSGIGGAIALGLGSRITAPHGGIIVIVGTDGAHLLQTLIALLVGTLVSALIYGLIKPKLTETEIEASKSMDE